MKVKFILTVFLMLFTASVFAQRTLNPDNIQTLNGTITNVDHPIAKFKTDEGKEYDLRMGPYWFWQNNNYSLTVNTNASVKGEIKNVNGKNEIYPFEIQQKGITIKLADENGLPLWSKGGKGKNNSYGWKKANGKNRGRGQCWRRDNAENNSEWRGRGFGRKAINCPYRNNN